MSFTTTALVGNRVLVTGTDFLGTEGKAVLDSSQWVAVNARKQHKQASKEFDDAVEEFFKPLTEAADKAQQALAGKTQDPVEFVVLSEATDGVKAKPAQIVALSKDSIIIRLIEEGTTDRLVWVNDTTLGVLAA